MSKFFERSPGNYEVVADLHTECKDRLATVELERDRALEQRDLAEHQRDKAWAALEHRATL